MMRLEPEPGRRTWENMACDIIKAAKTNAGSGAWVNGRWLNFDENARRIIRETLEGYGIDPEECRP